MAGKTDDDVLYLDLMASKFDVLPTDLCKNFSKLNNIDMWHVGLKRLSEQSFASCQNVENLGIGSNKLSKLPARSFKNLRKFKILAIDGNPIEEIEKMPLKDSTN